jgi:CO/xanthine dehydrogenase FAD-binding subunit
MQTHFKYLRPDSATEAVGMKDEHKDRAIMWAGGTDMVLRWKRHKVDVDYCIDLTYLKDLDYIKVAEDGIRIGAMTSLLTLEKSAHQHSLLKVLSDVTKLMCTPQTRSIATVGGNLCNASPAADLSAPLVALNSQVAITRVDGESLVSLDDFFLGVNHTVATEGGLVTEVIIPLPAGNRVGASYRRIDRTVVDIALVNSGVSVTVDANDEITATGIAMGAVAPVVIRSSAGEQLLVGESIQSLSARKIEQAADRASQDAKPIDDVRASAAYRQAMVKVMARRALEDAVISLGGTIL